MFSCLVKDLDVYVCSREMMHIFNTISQQVLRPNLCGLRCQDVVLWYQINILSNNKCEVFRTYYM